MMKAKRNFENAEAAREFVMRTEAEFEERLSSAVEQVSRTENLRLICLSGPTCAGKTTTAAKLIENMSEEGRGVYVISIDDFYLDRSVLEARLAANPGSTIDYDSEDTIDFEALEACVAQVFTDEPTMVPKFDFITGRRSGYIQIDSEPEDLFIFEGIQAIYPKVTALFHHYIYKSLYINVESALDMEGTIFEPNELRLMRRLVRDYKFRGASPEFTFYLWESVRANEELNILPYTSECDYFINSTLPFEVNLLSPYLKEILGKVPAGDKYYAQAREMLDKISGIEPVPEKYLLKDSLCNEFINRS